VVEYQVGFSGMQFRLVARQRLSTLPNQGQPLNLFLFKCFVASLHTKSPFAEHNRESKVIKTFQALLNEQILKISSNEFNLHEGELSA